MNGNELGEKNLTITYTGESKNRVITHIIMIYVKSNLITIMCDDYVITATTINQRESELNPTRESTRRCHSTLSGSDRSLP